VAHIEFWGGVGVIGSSKVLIHDGGHRVLLDLGLDIPRGGDLFRVPAARPRGRAGRAASGQAGDRAQLAADGRRRSRPEAGRRSWIRQLRTLESGERGGNYRQ
jgi:hypothetical protein